MNIYRLVIDQHTHTGEPWIEGVMDVLVTPGARAAAVEADVLLTSVLYTHYFSAPAADGTRQAGPVVQHYYAESGEIVETWHRVRDTDVLVCTVPEERRTVLLLEQEQHELDSLLDTIALAARRRRSRSGFAITSVG